MEKMNLHKHAAKGMMTSIVLPLTVLFIACISPAMVSANARVSQVAAKIIFSNENKKLPQTGCGRNPSFTIPTPHKVISINNDHFNFSGTPGVISLRDSSGKIYGPWQSTGMNGIPYPQWHWEIFPDIVIPPGKYEVIDSDPASWSCNAASNNEGMTVVKAIEVNESAPVIPAATFDLTGVWKDNQEGLYYITQRGDEVWWFAEQTSLNPLWSHVAHGAIKNGTIIELRWTGVPKGKMMDSGTVLMEILSNNELIRKSSAGDAIGEKLTR